MFLYYREQSKSVNSVTEVLTSMGLLIWKNFDYNIIVFNNINYNIIVCVLLFLLLITVLKNSK